MEKLCVCLHPSQVTLARSRPSMGSSTLQKKAPEMTAPSAVETDAGPAERAGPGLGLVWSWRRAQGVAGVGCG